MLPRNGVRRVTMPAISVRPAPAHRRGQARRPCLQTPTLPDGLPAAFGPVLLPDDVPVFVGDTFTPCDEQPAALLARAARPAAAHPPGLTTFTTAHCYAHCCVWSAVLLDA